MNTQNKLWGGRFEKQSAKLLDLFNASLPFDKNLYHHDIKGSIAHATMLAKQNIITKDECDKIIQGLKQIESEIENDKFIFDIKDEDIHMAIEKRLTQIIGEIGGKLHTARSRNDQVALDFRLFCLDESKIIAQKIFKLIKVILKLAKENLDTLMPGFTHLQHAQPISFSFYILAYGFMFQRDLKRFLNYHENNNILPLGCAALAGTPHDIDRNFVAKQLGFSKVSQNCLDTVSDRDFALELLFNISTLAMHISRISEELVIYSTSEFKFISISDEYATGSSIMPQKKNPDVPELLRGKTGRVYGNLFALFTVMKALPLAYNKDTQEDKESVFDSVATIKINLDILTKLLENITLNKQNMQQASKSGHLSATDLADFLVSFHKIPFRQAHFIVGKAVFYAESKNVDLSELSLEELQNIDEKLDERAKQKLSLQKSVDARNSIGGTSKLSCQKQIKELEEFLSKNEINS